MGRFINADGTDVLDIDQENLIEHNLFSYCLNNPIMLTDPDGDIAIVDDIVIIGGIIIISGILVSPQGKKTTNTLGSAIVSGVKSIANLFSKSKSIPQRKGIKGQGKEKTEKKKGSKDWEDKSGRRRPSTPKRHTPSKDHRHYFA